MQGSRKWLWLSGLVFFLVLFGPQMAEVYVDSLWFGSLGYSPVFWFGFWVKWALFLGFFIATTAILQLGFMVLRRTFGHYGLSGSFVRFDRETVRVEPEKFLNPMALSISLFWGLSVGVAMLGRWQLFTLFLHRTTSTVTDPIFGKSLDFFLFSWPVQRMLASWLKGLAVIILLAAVVYALLVLVSHLPSVLKREAMRIAARACSLILALTLVLQAWNTYLDRYSLIWQDHDIFTGIGYTEAKVLLPGANIVVATILLAAAIAVANAFVWKRGRIVAAALALPVFTSFGLGLVANYVSNFVVKPNELDRQTPYIKHNIASTRQAFGLDKIKTRNFPTQTGLAALNLDSNSKVLDDIRLWDWRALQATLSQVQVLRTYYDFPDVDVDRYKINGKLRQVMIAARELDINRLPAASRNWVNDRLVYTHGYGVTMNTVNGFTPEGRPEFLLSDVPVRSSVPELQLKRPEIYFGQSTNTPVYVKTKQKEFDFPQGDDNAYTTYQGTGGIELGGSVRRLVLSWALGDLTKVPFSSDITSESRVLLHRNIRERVQKIAPFFAYDDDPYIVVGNDGHLYWMMDAFTTSNYYPYSRHYALGGSSTNYVRNSVKVVVDAYNGTTSFYVFDKEDPIINAYRGVFPGLFKDAAAMPAGLRDHVRYPEQLFRTQADVYGLYHMQDVRMFFGREDVWSVAGEGDSVTPDNVQQIVNSRLGVAAADTAVPLEPYFVLMTLPEEKAGDEFIQILPFTPSRRRNMIGWMAGRSDGENYGSLLAYNFPKSQLVDGPAQVKARINQDPYLSGQFNLWNQQGSEILRGNMLVIPLGRSLLYVEPIFLQAKQSPTPELRMVVLGTQERIVYGTNFREALTKLLGRPSSEVPTEGSQGSTPTLGGLPSPSGSSPVPATPAAVAPADRQALINRAADDLEAYQKLTAEGKYSEAGKRLEAVNKALGQLRR